MFYYGLHKKAGKSHELLCLPHCHRALAINNNISICQIALLILFSLCTFCRPSPFSLSFSLFFTGQAHFPGRQRTPDSTYYVLKLRTERPFACLGLCVLYCYRACNQPQYNECACVFVCVYVYSLYVFTICVCVENVKLVLCQGCCKLPLQFCRFNFKRQCCIVVPRSSILPLFSPFSLSLSLYSFTLCAALINKYFVG